MLEGLAAAGYYRCFYGRGKGELWAGIGTAGLSFLAFLFPEMNCMIPLLTSMWLMLLGAFYAEKADFARKLQAAKQHTKQSKNVEEIFAMGGVWLMACSFAGLWTDKMLLRTNSLQTALVAALFLMGAMGLLGRRKWQLLWMVMLAGLWLLVRFLSGIPYTESWQNEIMTASLYLTAGGTLVFWQIACVFQERGHLEDDFQGFAGRAAKMDEMRDGAAELRSGAEGSWQESAGREYRQLQIFEHDFRHHLDIVAALYEEENAAEARAYIEDLKQARESRRGQKIGGERELSYIMMAKKESCRQREISFSYQIVGSPRGIAQMDMTALLLNLLDNAIRACEKAPKPRSIAVMLLSRGELWEIEVINSGLLVQTGSQTLRSLLANTAEGQRLNPGFYIAEESEEAQIPSSNKMERKLHGIGLISVKQIVDKYQGTYRAWQEEGQVRQKLILVQREDSHTF